MSEAIDIKGLDKGAVLAALYNASQPLGMGFLHYDPALMTADEGRALVDDQMKRTSEFGQPRAYFDYLKGRVMKVEVSLDTLSPGGYDRDNGQGAARRALVDAGLLSA